MNIRLSLLEMAARYSLSRAHTHQLLQSAGLVDEPAAVARWLARGVAVLAAMLGGMGVVMWIAANWGGLGRTGNFAILQLLVLASGLGAAFLPQARAALGLLALLGTGALFAYFGQTYQTGADPWQLFALWGVLVLPMCLGARSDVLWVPWALVVMTAISLWTYTHAGQYWQKEPDQPRVHMLAWSVTLLVVGALSSALRRYTGAGLWGFRTAITLAIVVITMNAMGGLLRGSMRSQYALGVLVLLVICCLLCLPKLFDVFALCCVALALDGLLAIGFVRWMFEGKSTDGWFGILVMSGFFSATLLAGSVSAIVHLARLRKAQGVAV